MRAFQADYGSALDLLRLLLASPLVPAGLAAQVEAYDARRRSGLTKGITAERMHALTDDLTGLLAFYEIRYHVRQVSSVKTWAECGNRMSLAGLDVIPAKMADATSAGWHALYCAVRDCGMPDPASRRASAGCTGGSA